MIYLEKHNPKKNQRRFYRLSIHPNLFGEWTLFKEWGRIGGAGRIRLEWYETRNQVMTALGKAKTQKFKRGYQFQ